MQKQLLLLMYCSKKNIGKNYEEHVSIQNPNDYKYSNLEIEVVESDYHYPAYHKVSELGPGCKTNIFIPVTVKGGASVRSISKTQTFKIYHNGKVVLQQLFSNSMGKSKEN
jgi:hypothetical protein